MRVLQVLSTLNISSGIANFVINHYRKMIDYGIQFDFLLFQPVPNSYKDEVESLGGKVYYIEKPTIHFGKYNKEVKKFFTNHFGEWDIVHIHEILVQKWIIKNAKKFGGVKKIAVHSHAAKFVLPIYGVSRIKNKFLMFVKTIRNKYLLHGIRKMPDYFFACSNAAGLALYGKSINKKNNYTVIKNAIDSSKYLYNIDVRNSYRKQLSVSDKKVIVLVGRLCEEKNQILFLDVMKKLCDVGSSYMLLLVGEGHLRKVIEEKIIGLNLENDVMLLGNRTDVPNILLCADLVVLPSIIEGLGMALIEAQASGLPCIASTGVPREAEITPHVKFVDLNDGVQGWVEAVKDTEIKRYDTKKYIEESGYDINESVKKLSAIYHEMVGA